MTIADHCGPLLTQRPDKKGCGQPASWQLTESRADGPEQGEEGRARACVKTVGSYTGSSGTARSVVDREFWGVAWGRHLADLASGSGV